MANKRQLELARDGLLLGDCVNCQAVLPDMALIEVKRPYRWRKAWLGKSVCPDCGFVDEWYFYFCPHCDGPILDEWEEETCPDPDCDKPLY